jgi:FkbM family methyltransferase
MQPLILKTKYAFHLLLSCLKPDVILDIGSMDGADSKRFAKLVPTANIVAFEGNPHNYRAMLADEELKNQASIRIEHRIVSDVPGEARFFVQVPDSGDASFNRGRSSTLERTLDGAHSEEVVLDGVRVDTFLQDEFPAAQTVAAWVDVEGNTYSVMKSMAASGNRIKLLHVEVETQEIWPGQKLESDVLSLSMELGLVVVARGEDAQQRDLILLRQDWYEANKQTVSRILKIASRIGPVASRIAETSFGQRFLTPGTRRFPG